MNVSIRTATIFLFLVIGVVLSVLFWGRERVVEVDGGRWFPFQIEWEGVQALSGDLVDQEVAGKRGFVRAEADGTFRVGGERIRFFGVQVWPTEKDEDVKALGERFASLGLNLWRGRPALAGPNGSGAQEGLEIYDRFFAAMKKHGLYHHMQIRGSGALLGKARSNERFREFLGLKEKHLPGKDAFPSPGHFVPHDNIQILSYLMEPDLVRAERRWWTYLLNHRNPHTGTRYKDEPAVLCLELLNETYLLRAWEFGKLEPGDLPAYYESHLDQLWNEFLRDKIRGRKSEDGGRTPEGGSQKREQGALRSDSRGKQPAEGAVKMGLREWLANRWAEEGKEGLGADENPVAGTVKRLPARPGQKNDCSRVRTLDLMRFYQELQQRYFQESKEYLKSLGVQVAVVGSNWSQLSLPGLETLSGLDAVDTHIYYDTPWPQKKTGRYKNKSLYEVYGLLNLQSVLASNGLADTPFCLSETNWAFPNEYQFQFLPELISYASLQDWDALILFYHLNHPRGGIGQTRSAVFMNDLTANPVLLSQAYLASRVFRKRIIQSAESEVLIHYTERRATLEEGGTAYKGTGNGVRTETNFAANSYLACMSGDWVTPSLPYPYSVPGRDGIFNLPYEIGLKHKVRKRFSKIKEYHDGGVYWSGQDRALIPMSKKDRIRLRRLKEVQAISSDTGEIRSDQEHEILEVQTKVFQTLTGRLEGEMSIKGGSLALKLEAPLAGSVSVLALDGQSIRRSKQLVVSAVGRVRNTGMAWDESRTYVKQWGSGPVLCEVLPAQVDIDHDRAEQARVWALDGGGRKMEEVPAQTDGGKVRFSLDAARTVWYLVAVGLKE